VRADRSTEGIQWTPGSLLDSLTAAEQDALLNLGGRTQYAAGEVLLAEGDRTTFAVIILDGYVKITARTEDGMESLLAIRTPGDVIGELAAIDRSPRSATASAVGAVVARRVSQPELDQCFRRHPSIAVAFNRAVAFKLRISTRRRVDFRTRDAKVKLARALLELFEGPAGLRHAQGGLLITQSELAGLIGVSEPTVHKALRELRAIGAVTTSYRRLVISDVAALREVAGTAPPGSGIPSVENDPQNPY
jgi:CRP/FNR family cyclic AMP-dependent transcriptional regulator